MLPRIDDSSWPIVRIDFGEAITFDEITETGRVLQAIFEARGPFATLIDIGALSATATTALHRKRLAEDSGRLAAMGAILAESVVVPNPILRALYVGYTWAGKPKGYPSKAFHDSVAALAWAREQTRTALRPKPR